MSILSRVAPLANGNIFYREVLLDEVDDSSCTPLLFMHGWPQLSITWNPALHFFGELGFKAIAPDMPGYGRSTIPSKAEDYSLEIIVDKILSLLDFLGHEKAVFIGHDWGAPVAWSIAQKHPERCHGIVGICVPYLPEGYSVQSYLKYVDRETYPAEKFPAGQFEYQLYFSENFKCAVSELDANIDNAVNAIFQKNSLSSSSSSPSITAYSRLQGGLFGADGIPSLPNSSLVLGREEAAEIICELKRNGFSGPISWYLNGERNTQYAQRGGEDCRINLPALFIHATMDSICTTIATELSSPMRKNCSDLEEATFACGHWLLNEKPKQLNQCVAKWLYKKLPNCWST